ncbi:response regulator [Rhodobacterales bacterium HKCCE4037]|nr:response regulator [Rhodobacterales bacterium HKCCE4037]
MAKILLMEDDPQQRTLLASILEDHGHDVATAFNGTDALETARREPFDLVLTDIIVQVDGHSTPDGGISLIGKLRRAGPESATSKDVPIIAISGTYKNPGMEHILDTAKIVGATSELRKPIQKAVLLAIVTDTLQR